MAENEKSIKVDQSPLVIHSQYIKDLSLEIPHAPEIFKEMTKAPEVHVDISMKNQKLEDNTYNLSLTAKMNADLDDKKLFIVELTYASLVTVNVEEQYLEPVLYIELPRLMFPFVRSIIANCLSEAGLPPMMLTPIDFVALYNAKKAKEAEEDKKEGKKAK